jgi:nitronate monooxygenase
MARSPELLDQVLAKQPAALMLSFGELEPHASRIKAQGVPLICQFQGMKYLREAVDAGADIVVAEGCEAGGHSGYRGSFTLVPEAADYLAKHSPDTVLVAAGGVGDGRGLAAAFMLGADGVLVGTRFVACEESEAPEGFRRAIIRADGDSTGEVEVGRCGQEALLAQSGIRCSRPEQRLCCQVAWARAGDGEGDRRRA